MGQEVTSPSRRPAKQPVRRRSSVGRAARAGFGRLRGVVRRLWGAPVASVKVGRNLVHRMLHRSDYARWRNLENYEAWWDRRTEKIARLIPPASRVIEFGAGRRQLEILLDASCTYLPSDLCDRGPGTFVVDLNWRPLPSLGQVNVDTAVFGGVLEYIHDVESLVEWLAEQVAACVASYACVPPRRRFGQRFLNSFDRFYYGYMNSYSEQEIVDIFRRAGFRCIARDPWDSQRVFLFVNQRPRR